MNIVPASQNKCAGCRNGLCRTLMRRRLAESPHQLLSRSAKRSSLTNYRNQVGKLRMVSANRRIVQPCFGAVFRCGHRTGKQDETSEQRGAAKHASV